GGAALRGLEDDPHLVGRARRQRGRTLPRTVAQRLELVGDAAQVGIDGLAVVAAAAGGEVVALYALPVHRCPGYSGALCQRCNQSSSSAGGTGRDRWYPWAS